MNYKFFSLITLGTFMSLCLSVMAVLAALPPGSADKLKKEADEVLVIKIVDSDIEESKKALSKVIYTAEIKEVRQSKSGLQAGETVRIESYFVSCQKKMKGFVGPKPPPLLSIGWIGLAYLNAAKDGSLYKIAAHGDSFTDIKNRDSL